MTLYLDFRTSGVGGGIREEPDVREANGLVRPAPLTLLGKALPPDRIADREVVFATHGFNVSRTDAVHTLARLEQHLLLDERFVFVGVLWPGDWWLPVVNYPAEADDAVRCGRGLARFINKTLRRASGVSLVSHSLGGRLVLEAVKNLERPAHQVCLLAAAVDDDCLSTKQYADAVENADRISVLASRKDRVLQIAYPAGDFLSDLLYDDDSPTQGALGYHGPHPSTPAKVEPAQIPPAQKYGHGDYFPPTERDDEQDTKVARPEQFAARALRGLQRVWPPLP